jgi:flavin-dependent dehydrogenase
MTPVLATGPFDWPTSRVSAPGVVLVGDAAGYYDPLTGQGIHAALKGARLAATAVHQLLTEGDSEANRSTYDIAHRAAFRPARLVQRVIEEATQRPTLFEGIAAGLNAFPHVADALIGLTGDVQAKPTWLAPGNG